MRFMVLLKVEDVVGPDLAKAMRAYDAELTRAGVADPSRVKARGARIAEPTAEGRHVAGFWMFDVASREEAAAWVRRCPAPRDGAAEIEIRLLLDPGDLGERPEPAARAPVWERATAF